jgi:hypothetical protein
MNKQQSYFSLPSWAQGFGGGLVGSSAGLGFESLGFLVGIPAAGTGLWTYIGACKGDKRCETKVTDWFNKYKPSTQSSAPNGTGSQVNPYAAQNQAQAQALANAKPIDWKPFLIAGGSIAAVLTIGIILYKLSK